MLSSCRSASHPPAHETENSATLRVSQSLKQPVFPGFPLHLRPPPLPPYQQEITMRDFYSPLCHVPLFLNWTLQPKGWTALKKCSIINCISSAHDPETYVLSDISDILLMYNCSVCKSCHVYPDTGYYCFLTANSLFNIALIINLN